MKLTKTKKIAKTPEQFILLNNYCELCQSPIYIDHRDTRFCICCDWYEEQKSPSEVA